MAASGRPPPDPRPTPPTRSCLPPRVVATAAEDRLSNQPQFSLRLPRLLRKNNRERSAAKSLACIREPRPNRRKKGGVSRTLTADLLREEGRIRLVIIDTLAYTDLTRSQHKRALKVGALSEQRKITF